MLDLLRLANDYNVPPFPEQLRPPALLTMLGEPNPDSPELPHEEAIKGLFAFCGMQLILTREKGRNVPSFVRIRPFEGAFENHGFRLTSLAAYLNERLRDGDVAVRAFVEDEKAWDALAAVVDEDQDGIYVIVRKDSPERAEAVVVIDWDRMARLRTDGLQGEYRVRGLK